MKDHARERIELAVPRRAFERRLGMRVASIPAALDAGRAEIDVLGVGLAIELRRLKADHVHSCLTTIARQFADERLVEFGVGQPCSKLVDHDAGDESVAAVRSGSRSGWNTARPSAG